MRNFSFDEETQSPLPHSHTTDSGYEFTPYATISRWNKSKTGIIEF